MDQLAPRALAPRPALFVLPALAVMLALAACQPEAARPWSGYVEGDYVYVAAPLAGRLTSLEVRAGDVLSGPQPLFSLDAEAEAAARDEALARLQAARAQAQDAGKGRRAEELAGVEAQLAQARAQAELARSELQRQQGLADQAYIAPARLDEARTALTQAEARVRETQAALASARLPARSDERQAAEAQARAASQALRQAEWRLAQKQQRAPLPAQARAEVADSYFRVGEQVPAGQPVLALLPEGQVKARFYVPEADLARLSPGQTVQLRCDGCAAPVPARIRHIATQAEYTPPVIYSTAQRAKLVFRVEAWPVDPAQARALRPGLPVDVWP